MIYANQAATAYPKPQYVLKATSAALELTPSAQNQLVITGTHQISAYLGIENPDNFLFTNGCTAATMAALFNYAWEPGDLVLTSYFEHQSLLNVLKTLASRQLIRLGFIPYHPGIPVDLDWLSAAVTSDRPRMIACSTASNVTGEIAPIEALSDLCQEHGIDLFIDAAQTIGWERINIAKLRPTALVFAGHKGLMGPHGIGGLYTAPNFPVSNQGAQCELASRSCDKKRLGYCEVGSAPIAQIAGLMAAVDWHQNQAPQGTLVQMSERVKSLYDSIDGIGLVPLGGTSHKRRTPVLSFVLDNCDMQSFQTKLEASGLQGRYGFHCAPLIHEHLGLSQGSMRFSFGIEHSLCDIQNASVIIEKNLQASRST